MRKSLSVFDVVRFTISLVIFLILYLLCEEYFLSGMQTEEITMGFLVKRYFLVEGLGSFISLSLSLLIVSKRYRIVTGTLFMFGSLIFYLFSMVFTSLSTLMSFAVSIVGLSFVAVGTCSAILLWMFINSKITAKKRATIPIQKTSPKTSRILMFLSLISVPATYITMIISAFITLGLSLWVLGIVLQFPRIPIFILVAIGLAPLVSLWAAFRAIKAVFFSPPQFQASVNINLSNKPKLAGLIKQVCTKVNTKSPDNVILHSEPTFFVTEGGIKSLDGFLKGRTLAIGAPLLRHLDLDELRVIFAHEFAHFSGNDTAYSTFVVPVYKSITSAINDITGLSDGNQEPNNVMNFMNLLLFIPVIFLKIFLTYFATIDNILSRSRELRADWIAATNFGSNNMSSGLTKVIQISRHYNDSVGNIGYDNQNYFDKYDSLLSAELSKLDQYKQNALLETEEEFDSHPTLKTRLENLPLNAHEEKQGNIFEIQEELSEDEKRLSSSYQGLLKNYHEYQQTKTQLEKEFDAINNAQVRILQSFAETVRKDLKLQNEHIQCANACLIIGDHIPGEYKGKTQKLINLLKDDKKISGLFLVGIAIRINLLNQYGLGQQVDKIKAKYKELGIDLTSVFGQNLPSLQEFVEIVNESCASSK